MLFGSGLLSFAEDQPAARTARTTEQPADVLAARVNTRKAYVQAAEVDFRAAKEKLDGITRARASGTVSAEDVGRAQTEVDKAAALLEIRKAELSEAEVCMTVAKQPAGGAKAVAAPRIAVFNMAAIMRDYEKSKYQVYLLNQKRLTESTVLQKKRAEYIKIQQQMQVETDADVKDKLGKTMRTLTIEIEDDDRRINKLLNDEASKVIVGLYDDIKTVVDKVAEANGYDIVFSYPDAVTAAERNSSTLKELKLKPAAAQPFFVAKHADITDEVVQKLNAANPPLDAAGKKVDVNNLPALQPGPGAPVPKPQ